MKRLYLLGLCLCGFVVASSQAQLMEAKHKLRRVTFYFLDPLVTTPVPLSVDDVVASVEKGNSGTAKIHVEGSWAFLEISKQFAKQLNQASVPYWLRNSLDARIVVRFWSDEKTFRQLCIVSPQQAEWNNIEAAPLTSDEIRAVLSLLPKILFDGLYDPDVAERRANAVAPP